MSPRIAVHGPHLVPQVFLRQRSCCQSALHQQGFLSLAGLFVTLWRTWKTISRTIITQHVCIINKNKLFPKDSVESPSCLMEELLLCYTEAGEIWRLRKIKACCGSLWSCAKLFQHPCNICNHLPHFSNLNLCGFCLFSLLQHQFYSCWVRFV